jgi:hypothetical protein
MGGSRFSPFLTRSLLPIPAARLSNIDISSVPHGHSSTPHLGSTAPLLAHTHFLVGSAMELPQAAQTSYWSETSLILTLDRRT